MDPEHPIDGLPSVRLHASCSGEEGFVWLSCLYGSNATETERDIPMNAAVGFSCPHCREALAGSETCQECEGPMVPMTVDGGGVVRVCTRRGCKGHALDLVLDHC